AAEPDAARLLRAIGRRGALVPARLDGDAQPDEPLGGEGHRRGRHHRLDANRRERHRRRPIAPGRDRHDHARLARTGVADDLGRSWPGGPVMIPAAFDYVRASSTDEAVAALAEHGDDAKLLAGGHSLLPLMRLRLATPAVLVDIGRVSDLSYVT